MMRSYSKNNTANAPSKLIMNLVPALINKINGSGYFC